MRDPKVIAIQRQAGRDKVKAWADRKGRRTLAMTGGRKASVPCEAHPDPTVNQYMGRAGEEVLQAVNRMRAYDRTAASCCDVHVFGQFDTGLQVHEVCTQRDSEVDVFDLMRAQGVVLEGGESIEAAFPGWVGGGGQGRAMLAVSKRRIRTWAEERYEIQIGNSTSQLPIQRLHIGSRDDERLWTRVVFRRPGARFSETAHVNLSRHSDPKRAIRRLLGKGFEFESVGGVVETKRKTVLRAARKRASCEKYAAKSKPSKAASKVAAPIVKAPRQYPAGLVSTLRNSGVSLAALVLTSCSPEPPADIIYPCTDQRYEITHNTAQCTPTHIPKTDRRAGRSRRWRTPAEKQRAYRARKKQPSTSIRSTGT